MVQEPTAEKIVIAEAQAQAVGGKTARSGHRHQPGSSTRACVIVYRQRKWLMLFQCCCLSHAFFFLSDTPKQSLITIIYYHFIQHYTNDIMSAAPLS